MLIIDAIKQHVQKTGETIPEWAKYATQGDSRRIQYWERKPENTKRFYDFWDDYLTTDSIADFDVPDFCVDRKTPLKITDKVRDYVNQPDTLNKDTNKNRSAYSELPNVFKLHPGLTKREYFAAHALQGLLSDGHNTMNMSRTEIAQNVVMIADDILEQLKESNG